MASRTSSQVVRGDVPSQSSAGVVDEGNAGGKNSLQDPNAALKTRNKGGLAGRGKAFLVFAVIVLCGVNSADAWPVYLFAVGLTFTLYVGFFGGFWHDNGDSDYTDFDIIIHQVASKVHEELQEDEDGPNTNVARSPLLHKSDSAPPEYKFYYIEDRQFGISDKKSGEVFLASQNLSSILRLQFSQDSKGSIFNIQGSRTLLVKGEASDCKYTSFSVTQGMVSRETLRAYWVEEGEKKGKDGLACCLRRVISGQFDSEYSAISGEWLSSDGNRGSFAESYSDVSVDYAIPMTDQRDANEQ